MKQHIIICTVYTKGLLFCKRAAVAIKNWWPELLNLEQLNLELLNMLEQLNIIIVIMQNITVGTLRPEEPDYTIKYNDHVISKD